MKLKILSILFLLSSGIFAQDKSDYNWLFSNEFTDEFPLFEGSIIDFNNHSRELYEAQLPIELGVTNAIISDKESGELLFYSAGCSIVNADHEIMENGDQINPGEIHDNFCPDGGEYPQLNSTLILDNPFAENLYYVIHQNRDSLNAVAAGLLYSVVDMSLESGNGAVVEKNIQLLDYNSIKFSYMTAIRKSSAIGWWLIVMEHYENELVVFSVESDGIFEHKRFEQDFEFSDFTSNSGHACFSPQGDKFAWFNPWDGVFVFDFDIETAELEFLWHEGIPDDPDVFNPIGAPQFSPSGQYLYLSSDWYVHQIDTWDINPPSTLELIAEWDGFGDPLPVGFASCLLGPDCKIYLASRLNTKHLGIIRNPDERGQACNLIQHDLELPWHKHRGIVPNFPTFRNNESSPCDDQITSTSFIEEIAKLKVNVFPSPADSKVVFNFPRPMSSVSKLSLFDVNGRLVKSESIKKHQISKRISVDNFDSGIYFWKLVNDKGILSSGKLVKN